MGKGAPVVHTGATGNLSKRIVARSGVLWRGMDRERQLQYQAKAFVMRAEAERDLATKLADLREA
eukprot:14829184-Alexandrium_andersonii.AAC.1